MSRIRFLKRGRIEIRDAEILYENFRGIGSDYNTEGNRNFCAYFDDEEVVEELQRDGWNFKRDSKDRAFTQVVVSYRFEAPEVGYRTETKSVRVTEKSIGRLDGFDMENISIVLHPVRWEKGGRSGKKAYLDQFYCDVVGSILSDEYGMDNAVWAEDDDELPFSDND